MKVVFLGTAPLALPSLRALLESRDVAVVGVVTQPDRPRGRNQRLDLGPVKQMALQAGAPLLTPGNINEPASLEALRSLAPDLMVVVAYGQILKKSILEIPPLGCINVHPSLLPKFRGAAPIQWTLLKGETVTGITTMYMNEGMDAGDILFQREVAVDPEETAGSLHDRMAVEGADLLGHTIKAIAEGRAVRTPQDDTQATLAPKLKKEDGRIEWSRPAAEIYNQVRAFNPWPCCFSEVKETDGRKQVLRIWRVAVEPGNGRPGDVLDVSGGPLIAAGDGGVRLLEVQAEGGKRMSGVAYLCGHPMAAGMSLG